MLPTITDLTKKLSEGVISPVDLLDTCLAQVDRFERSIHAWVLVDRERARDEAVALTEELRRGIWRGPLHGMPIGIKDIIDVFDWPTAAGSTLWAKSIARQDADVVRQLRQAGAVIMGKTVTTQYASFDPSPTRNPWNPDRTPGGSSSGSAAAVASGMCLAALGSQTGGSLNRPASYCGVAGFKPSFGLVSNAGVVPLAPSMDHIGPMARSVGDLALILDVLAIPGRRRTSLDSLVNSKPGAPNPPRLGILGGFFEVHAQPAVKSMMETVQRTFSSNGAEIVMLEDPPGLADVVDRHGLVMAAEAAIYHGERLRRHSDDYLPCIRQLIEEGLVCSDLELTECRRHQTALSQDMENRLSTVDALLAPATTSEAPDRATTGDSRFNAPWSYTGLPSLSLPAAKTSSGMPLAIQLIGKRFGEPELVSVAAWCEAQLGWNYEIPPILT